MYRQTVGQTHSSNYNIDKQIIILSLKKMVCYYISKYMKKLKIEKKKIEKKNSK